MGRKSQSTTAVGDGTRFINLANFYSKCGELDANGCIPWLGVKNNIGYPFFNFARHDGQRGGMMTGHRIALMLKLGRDIATGMNANHSCHNRWCVNPDHLSEGTQQQKIQDMVVDQKHNVNRPPRVPYMHKQHNRQYKYSEEEIQFMRLAPVKEIQKRFNCTIKRAYKLRSGSRRDYKWLPLPEELTKLKK